MNTANLEREKREIKLRNMFVHTLYGVSFCVSINYIGTLSKIWASYSSHYSLVIQVCPWNVAKTEKLE